MITFSILELIVVCVFCLIAGISITNIIWTIDEVWKNKEVEDYE